MRNPSTCEAWVDVKGYLYRVDAFRALTGENDGLVIVSLTGPGEHYAGTATVLCEDVFIGQPLRAKIAAANWSDDKRDAVRSLR